MHAMVVFDDNGDVHGDSKDTEIKTTLLGIQESENYVDFSYCTITEIAGVSKSSE